MVGPHLPTHAEAVAETLDALDLTPADKAASRLAETYARQLDRAKAIEAQADRVLHRIDDAELAELVQALKAKLSAQTTLATIGPRLLDVLTALGAHPRSRAQLGKGGAGRGPSKLAGLRAARQ